MNIFFCNNIENDIKIYFAVLLGVFSLTKVQGKIQGKKIPSVIKKLNKALGLEKNSEKVWDILSISDNAANIAKYHPNETSKWLCRCCTKYLPQISYHEKYQWIWSIKLLSIKSTGCGSHFQNPANFKILKVPVLVFRQTIPQKKAVIWSPKSDPPCRKKH